MSWPSSRRAAATGSDQRPRPPRSNAPPSSRPTGTWQRNALRSLLTMPSSPGTSHESRALVDRVLALGSLDRPRGEALFTLGLLEQYAGSVPRSAEYLDEASHLLEGVALVRCLTELAMARFRLNDLAGFADCAHRIDAAADHDDPEQQLMASFTGGGALVLAGDFEAGMARLAEVRRLADLPALRHDPRALLLMALAVSFTGEVGDAVEVGAVRLQEVRRRGAIGVLVPALAILAAGKGVAGRPRRCVRGRG